MQRTTGSLFDKKTEPGSLPYDHFETNNYNIL